MPYTTLQNLTDAFGAQLLIGLTDRGELATDTIDTDVVDAALANTDAVINGYLKRKYTLPLSDAQPLIGDLALTITIYKLHIYSPEDKITADYKAAIRSLEQISTGTIQLSAAGIAPEGNDSGGARVTDRERPMTAENLKGWI